MITTFFHPSDPVSKQANQSTLVLERKVGENTGVFIECVGDFPSNASARHLLNVRAGLNKDAPSFVFGLGYSYRLNRLF